MSFSLVNVLAVSACVIGIGVDCFAADENEQVDAYYAAKIWTGTEIIDEGVLLVRNGAIVDVGPRSKVEVPVESRRHELGNANLIPGLVIAQSNLVEARRESEYAVRPEVRAVDGFDPFEDYDPLLAAGVTTVQISPESDRLIPGQGSVVKLAGKDAMRRVLSATESLSIVLSRSAFSPSTIYEPPVGAVSVERPIEPTRPQLATSLAQAVVGLRALLAESKDNQAGTSDDPMLEALVQLIEGKGTVRWTARSDAEIGAALSLAEEFELPWMIVDPTDIDHLLEVDDWNSPDIRGVILDAEIRPGEIVNPSVPSRLADEELPVWVRAAQLIEAGAGDKLALRASSDSDLSQMMFLASILGRGGVTTEQTLKLLTSNPAVMMGVADRVGSLKKGLDADFVVLTDVPLSNVSRVAATFVEGQKVYSAPQSENSVVIKAGSVVTPSGTVSKGQIAVAAGKIVGVGLSVSATSDAVTMDFGDQAYVVPGYIDMSAKLGTGGLLSERISLGTKLGEFLSRDDEQIDWARRGGVTTSLLSSSRLPSPVVAFKLGDEPKVVKDPVAVRYAVGQNLTATENSMRRTLAAGKAYADSWTKYKADFADYEKKLKAYEAAKKKYDAAKKAAEKEREEQQADKEKSADGKQKNDGKSKQDDSGTQGNRKDPVDAPEKEEAEQKGSGDQNAGASKNGKQADDDADSGKSKPDAAALKEPTKPEEPKKPKANDSLEPYRALFAREIVAIVEAKETKAVELAVKLFRTEFQLKTAIVAGEAAAEIASLLADSEVLAIVGPEVVGEQDGELVNYAAQLGIQQASVAFQSDASTGVRELPQAISFAVYQGLSAAEAVDSLTAIPSEFLGLDAIGAIEPGKDADLVVLSGPPMELSSEVLAVMIDGSWVYEKESD